MAYPLSFLPPAPSLTSYSSGCIVQLPAVCHSVSSANHVTKLAIILAMSYLLLSSPPAACSSPSSSLSSCSSRRVHLVVLIALCSSRCAQRVVSYLPTFLCFRAKCGSSIYRYTLDRMNRTGLSHSAWNPLHVCECDKRICCDVPCLDCQRDRGAMTRVVQTPFALTRLRPEGKCPDTTASRRKMPWHGCVQKENALTHSVQ